nr:unnamed protein product [Digitaria exilis]
MLPTPSAQISSPPGRRSEDLVVPLTHRQLHGRHVSSSVPPVSPPVQGELSCSSPLLPPHSPLPLPLSSSSLHHGGASKVPPLKAPKSSPETSPELHRSTPPTSCSSTSTSSPSSSFFPIAPLFKLKVKNKQTSLLLTLHQPATLKQTAPKTEVGATGGELFFPEIETPGQGEVEYGPDPVMAESVTPIHLRPPSHRRVWPVFGYFYPADGGAGMERRRSPPPQAAPSLVPPLATSTGRPGPVPPDLVASHRCCLLTPPDTYSRPQSSKDRCRGQYIYMYDLPLRFNDDNVRHCSTPAMDGHLPSSTPSASRTPPALQSSARRPRAIGRLVVASGDGTTGSCCGATGSASDAATPVSRRAPDSSSSRPRRRRGGEEKGCPAAAWLPATAPAAARQGERGNVWRGLGGGALVLQLPDALVAANWRVHARVVTGTGKELEGTTTPPSIDKTLRYAAADQFAARQVLVQMPQWSKRATSPQFVKPFPLDGADGCLRWKESVLLRLHTVGVAHVLSDEPPPAPDGSRQAAKKWERDDAMCRGNILAALSDHLLPVYVRHGTGRALWQARAGPDSAAPL